MKLTKIQDGEVVAIDTNILVYANQQYSPQCVHLLRRCGGGEVKGVVPMPMVSELVHTLMLIEARDNNWIKRSNPARYLSEHPELVRRLLRYGTQIREFLGIGLRIEQVTSYDIHEVLNIQSQYGLLTNDAFLLAVARRLNCDAIISADKAFKKVKDIRIYSPTDIKIERQKTPKIV